MVLQHSKKYTERSFFARDPDMNIPGMMPLPTLLPLYLVTS